MFIVSPVKLDSSVCISFDDIKMQSAGIFFPDYITTKSPTTNSSEGIVMVCEFLITIELV